MKVPPKKRQDDYVTMNIMIAQHRRRAESGDSKQMKNWKKQLIMKI